MGSSPEEKILKLIAWVERVLFYSLIGILILVVAVQYLFTSGKYQAGLSNLGRFTGTMQTIPALAINEDESIATLNIEVLGQQTLRYAYIIVNESRVANFTNPEIEIKVKNNQKVSIDGSFYNRPLTFHVTFVSKGVVSPVIGQEITTCGSCESLGKVLIK